MAVLDFVHWEQPVAEELLAPGLQLLCPRHVTLGLFLVCPGLRTHWSRRPPEEGWVRLPGTGRKSGSDYPATAESPVSVGVATSGLGPQTPPRRGPPRACGQTFDQQALPSPPDSVALRALHGQALASSLPADLPRAGGIHAQSAPMAPLWWRSCAFVRGLFASSNWVLLVHWMGFHGIMVHWKDGAASHPEAT